ncbi:F-box/kelch-repeat protein At3g06240-like [Papaver somniferum]|uniref:F-box/kelch-repeat protein At3g06240-like n=1 Tax=Papaver somniferum TaxID=3469 RepID=UPI000E6F7652|nr:F-box/kelch-repeat protein At3g06240-like [Papaver somniferum]
MQFMDGENPHILHEAASTTPTGMSSLPEEIQVDIFMMLPVKCISVCRCVCKLWCNLLFSPKFIKHHLNNGIRNHKLMLIDNINRLDTKYFSICSIDFAPETSSALLSFNSALKLEFPIEYKEHFVQVLGSCNGLVCLGMQSIDWHYKINVFIWNPLIRKYKEILTPFSFSSMRYGFGYDCINDTFKPVRIGENKETRGVEIQVYTLGSDSWDKTQPIPYSFPLDHRNDSGLLFNGALHWFGINTAKETSFEVIISFNISTKRFIDVPLPEYTSRYRNRRQYRSVALLGDNLCLFDVDSDVVGISLIEIWVMLEYGVRVSWSKQFSFTEQFPGFAYDLTLVCALGNGELMMVSSWNVYLYDPKKKRRRDLNVQTGMVNKVVTYVDSLVSPI